MLNIVSSKKGLTYNKSKNKGYSGYLYGFNGMEKDDEVSGQGNSYTTEFRQYDARLGRWTALDPLMGKFPDISPYAAFNNNPIYFSDPTGLAPEGKGDPIKINENSRSGNNVTVNEGIQLPTDPTQGQTQEFIYRNGDKAIYSFNEESDMWSLTVDLVNESKDQIVTIPDLFSANHSPEYYAQKEAEEEEKRNLAENVVLGSAVFASGESVSTIAKSNRLKTSNRYKLPDTPIKVPGGYVSAPTKVVNGVVKYGKPLLKGAGTIMTAVDVINHVDKAYESYSKGDYWEAAESTAKAAGGIAAAIAAGATYGAIGGPAGVAAGIVVGVVWSVVSDWDWW